MSADQCGYMAAAYPELDGDDTCNGFHRHEPRVYTLAKALSDAFQGVADDERIAWFLNDADAVVDDFTPPKAWVITEKRYVGSHGIDTEFKINGRPYVIPESEWEPAVPVSRETWDKWRDEAEL